MTNPLIAARTAFGARHPETRRDLNGRDWGVIDTGGTGPAMLFIPGTLGRADVFWNQMAALGECRVLSVSYPAAGGVDDWVEDLASLLDQCAIPSTAVLGSSLGGYVAQTLAARHPGRVSHLFAAHTLADATGIAQRPPYALDLETAPIDDLRAGFRAGLGAWKQAHPDQADLVDLLLADVAGRIPEPEIRARLAALKHARPLPADARPPAQTTILDSADDPLIPPPLREGVRARFPLAQAFRFAWGGHFPYLARPATYTALLRARLGLAPLPAEWAGGEA